jgi:hypothetical protein
MKRAVWSTEEKSGMMELRHRHTPKVSTGGTQTNTEFSNFAPKPAGRDTRRRASDSV